MIQLAAHEDIPLLVEMMEEFYAESDVPLDHCVAAASFKTLLEKPDFGAIWIYFDGSEAVGYVVLTVCFSMEFGGLDGNIDDLYVRPSARRKGFGQELVQSLLIECHDRGLEALHVEVAPLNGPAKAVYERIGLQLREDDRDVMTAKLKGEF